MTETTKKIVVVGDGMVGKTALLSAFVNGAFQDYYIPTVFETSAKEVELPDGRHLILGLWDTGGQEEFDQIRQLAYPGASLILLCYAVDCPTSLENIVHTWLDEVKCYCPHIPLILVGCKADKRVVISPGKSNNLTVNTSQTSLIDPTDVERVSKQIGAQIVIECSALTRSNVNCIFELAARIILDTEKENMRSSKFCNILPIHRKKSISNGVVTGHSVITRRSSELKRRISSSNYFCFLRRR
ncbi:GTP-binding protein [Schistosoma japonicum]|uniref:GTP-binding protein n=1 Tax=Schistosoma japonicum TaxID=6182 RepID=C1LGU8_SCHJA|nr:GTP-binding protein [Schistosoma japonicum]CAX73926.1 GTP-binding protein rhoA precursor [Schistosoma japonicum]